jgi:hypothetical protein
VTDRLQGMNIAVESPDRTVRATVTHRSGIKVDFDDDVADVHTEESLGTQIEAVLTGAAQGFDKFAEAVHSETRDGGADLIAPERKQRAEERGEHDVGLIGGDPVKPGVLLGPNGTSCVTDESPTVERRRIG